MTGQRAQVFTLEGVFAALVVLAGLVFALQAVVLAPSTGSSSTTAAGDAQLNSIVTTAAENGDLKKSLLFWNPNTNTNANRLNGFHNTSQNVRYYTGTKFNESNGRFAATLDDGLDQSTSMNILIHYQNASHAINGTFPMVLNGEPSANSVRSSTTVAIYDSDRLVKNATEGIRSSTTVRQANQSGVFYAPDAYPDRELFNVVEVEVVVWET